MNNMGYTVQVQELFSVSFTTAIIKMGKEGKPIFFLNAREVIILMLIIHMKKLLDSDWLRAVQFMCLIPSSVNWRPDLQTQSLS